MSAFKVGDKVRIGEKGGEYGYDYVGLPGTVVSLESDILFRVRTEHPRNGVETFTYWDKELVAEDVIEHPKHYTSIDGLECIDVAKHFNFNCGNVIKYVWRAGLKSDNAVEDLQKARAYINFEIDRLGGEA